jgi:hypothetical protein
MAGEGQKYVLFVWTPGGYQLHERDGEPPAVGTTVELEEHDGRRYFVSRIGTSPLPADRRPCAYLQGVS